MTLDEIAEMYGLLADTTRLRILNLLRGGPLCVCHIVAALELPQSTVSRHLSWLKTGGLINLQSIDRYSIYELNAASPNGETVVTAAEFAALTEVCRGDIARLPKSLKECEVEYITRTK
jgi:ArsR family transcriptional regulator